MPPGRPPRYSGPGVVAAPGSIATLPCDLPRARLRPRARVVPPTLRVTAEQKVFYCEVAVRVGGERVGRL